MIAFRLAAGLAAAALVFGGEATAKDLPKGGLTAKEVQAWLFESGYQAELDKDGDEPFIKSAADGVNFEVHLYDCEKDRCASIQLTAGFDVKDKMSVDEANAWNSDKRYVDCFIDEEGDPWFTYDINLSPGGTRESLDDDFQVWLSFLPDMKSHIGW